MRIEKVDVGPHVPGIDPLVVVDDRHDGCRGLGHTAVAGGRDPGTEFVDKAEPARGVHRGEGLETCRRIVRRVVVHDNALPLRSGQILPHDGLQGHKKLRRTIVRRDDERKTNHYANIANYP